MIIESPTESLARSRRNPSLAGPDSPSQGHGPVRRATVAILVISRVERPPAARAAECLSAAAAAQAVTDSEQLWPGPGLGPPPPRRHGPSAGIISVCQCAGS